MNGGALTEPNRIARKIFTNQAKSKEPVSRFPRVTLLDGTVAEALAINGQKGGNGGRERV